MQPKDGLHKLPMPHGRFVSVHSASLCCTFHSIPLRRNAAPHCSYICTHIHIHTYHTHTQTHTRTHRRAIRDLADSICRDAQWVDLKGKDSVPDTVEHVLIEVGTSSRAECRRSHTHTHTHTHPRRAQVPTHSLLPSSKGSPASFSS